MNHKNSCPMEMARKGEWAARINPECTCTPAPTEVCACDNPRGFYNQLNERTISYDCRTCGKPIHLELTKPSPASTEVKCGPQCAVMSGCMISPASTEVKCECKRILGGEIYDTAFCPIHSPASTEDWVNRAQKAIDIFHGEKGKECPICGVNPKKWIEELSSHDQQLRQRIVEEMNKNGWIVGTKEGQAFKEETDEFFHFITNLK